MLSTHTPHGLSLEEVAAALQDLDVIGLGRRADAACRARFGTQAGYHVPTHLRGTAEGWRLWDRGRALPQRPLGSVRILEWHDLPLPTCGGVVETLPPTDPDMEKLRAAGVQRVIVGPVEVFDAGRRSVRAAMPWAEAVSQMRAAAAAGLRLAVGFAYGNDESADLLAARLEDVRAVQHAVDVFAPVPINPQREQEQQGEISFGYDDMRLFAAARLFLDGVAHIQVPWLAFGLKAGQMSLLFGANDLGPWVADPAVVGDADLSTYLAIREEEVVAAIRALKLEPVRYEEPA